MVEKFVPKELNITENAVLKVKNLIAEENKKKSSPQGFCNWRRLFGFSVWF